MRRLLADSAEIQIAYDGRRMPPGVMDVRELAPALLSLGDLCQRSNLILNGDRAEVSVRVRGDFRSGSFVVNIEVVQSLVEQAKGLLFGTSLTDTKTLLEIIGLMGTGGMTLFKLVKWLHGKRPKAVTTIENGLLT